MVAGRFSREEVGSWQMKMRQQRGGFLYTYFLMWTSVVAAAGVSVLPLDDVCSSNSRPQPHFEKLVTKLLGTGSREDVSLT